MLPARLPWTILTSPKVIKSFTKIIYHKRDWYCLINASNALYKKLDTFSIQPILDQNFQKPKKIAFKAL